MRSWVDPKHLAVPESFIKSIGGHPLVAQTLFRRGIRDIPDAHAFINPLAYKPTPPTEMSGVNLAVDILEEAIQNGQKIGVWGDFDVDGQSATAVLVSTLTDLGANVSFHIPDRTTESHGINIHKLHDLIVDGIQVLISCDTGISDHDAVDYAIQSGLQVVITDHHDLPVELPRAHAIVNPKLLPKNHPLSALPGVGVAYKVAEEIYLRSRDIDKTYSNFDLVALGIVADMALQVDDTRYLLQRGLNEIRRNPRTGLRALLDIAGIDPENVTDDHISYILAPRLNALGRLSDARLGVELLLTEDFEFAKASAIKLEALNEDRRLITQQVFQAVLSQIDVNPGLTSEPAIILENSTWPVGIIGIVANRLVEYYHRPAILISTPPNQLARGSARSVEGINITEAIAAQKDYLESYGGHPMAAGFSIRKELLPQFKKGIFESLSAESTGLVVDDSLQIDNYMMLSDLTFDFISEIERLAPFGPGNPPLTLASRDLNIKSYTKIGRNEEHLILTIEDKFGTTIQTIWWQGAGWPLPDRMFDLAYTVRTSTYRGQKSVQVEWLDYKYTSESPLKIVAPKHEYTIFDYRRVLNPKNILDQLLSNKNILVWREGGHQKSIQGGNRFELGPAHHLAIWTIPPGRKELNDALELVNPTTIYLFGVDPGMDNAKAFIIRLAGLLKYVMDKKHGVTNIYSLSAACAQRINTVKEGIKWLQANGYFHFNYADDDNLVISEGVEGENIATAENSHTLNSLLKESAAFRAFYLRVNKDSLFFQDR